MAQNPLLSTGNAHTLSSNKYLVFSLENEEYGVEILRVQEIISMLPITSLPRTVPWIRGMMNLRGQIIPVVDLRIRFGITVKTPPEEKCVVIVRSQGTPMGLIVDRVYEVMSIPTEQIEQEVSGRSDIYSHFISGIGKSENRVRFLLDIDQVVGQSVRTPANAEQAQPTRG